MKKHTLLSILLLFAFCGTLISCDSNSSGTQTDGNPLNGTWEAAGPDAVDYVKINMPSMDIYDNYSNKNCYEHDSATLKKLSGNKYVTLFSGDKPDTVSLNVENNTLTVIQLSYDNEILKFTRSNTDVSSFTICKESSAATVSKDTGTTLFGF